MSVPKATASCIIIPILSFHTSLFIKTNTIQILIQYEYEMDMAELKPNFFPILDKIKISKIEHGGKAVWLRCRQNGIYGFFWGI